MRRTGPAFIGEIYSSLWPFPSSWTLSKSPKMLIRNGLIGFPNHGTDPSTSS